MKKEVDNFLARWHVRHFHHQ